MYVLFYKIKGFMYNTYTYLHIGRYVYPVIYLVRGKFISNLCEKALSSILCKKEKKKKNGEK